MQNYTPKRFDYLNKQRELLQKKLIKINHEKVIKI